LDLNSYRRDGPDGERIELGFWRLISQENVRALRAVKGIGEGHQVKGIGEGHQVLSRIIHRRTYIV